MSSDNDKVIISSGRIGLCGVFFFILFLLKVGVVDTTVIGWSWWWITAPLWGPIGIIIIVPIVAVFLVAVGCLISWLFISSLSLISRVWKKMRK